MLYNGVTGVLQSMMSPVSTIVITLKVIITLNGTYLSSVFLGSLYMILNKKHISTYVS